MGRVYISMWNVRKMAAKEEGCGGISRKWDVRKMSQNLWDVGKKAKVREVENKAKIIRDMGFLDPL